MKTIEVINENCSYGNMREEMEKALRELKPFSRSNAAIPFEKLEKLATKYMCKYNVGIQWIRPSAQDDRIWYSAEVSIRDPYKPYMALKAGSMYELYAKICLTMSLAVSEGSAATWEAVMDRRWERARSYSLPDAEKSPIPTAGNGKPSEPKNSKKKKGGIYAEISGKSRKAIS